MRPRSPTLLLLALLSVAGCADLGGGGTPTSATPDAALPAGEPAAGSLTPAVPVRTLLGDPRGPGVLRVVSYNVEKNSPFESGSPQAARFLRLVQATRADIYALQEVWDGPDEVAAWFDKQVPLPGGATWAAVDAGSTMTVSRFPVKHHRATTWPDCGRKVGLTWIDVPQSLWDTPLYLINAHMTCCGSGELNRQREADAVAAWIRTLRAAGGPLDLPPSVPLMMIGDFNLVGGTGPLDTLRTGDISDEATWGADAAPDSDGTPLYDVRPRHNGDGDATWTWRWDGSGFGTSRIDIALVSDSLLDVVGAAALNTTSLSAAELGALGLDRLDVGKRALGDGWVLDHLPLVLDLRLRSDR